MRTRAAVAACLTLAMTSGAAETVPAGMTAAQVVVLGEVHDNPRHHVTQAALTATLAPVALVFEMFPQASDAALNAARGAGADREALAALLDWDNSGWPDFAFYAPILEAAPDARVYGAAIPREVLRRSVGEGAAAILGEDAGRLGLTAPLPEDQQAEREAMQAEAHCDALPPEMLPGMVEAQRARDAALARAVLAALDEQGAPVVVITGNGHARTDWGMPAILARAAPGVTVFSYGQFEAEPEAPVPFDAWTVADPVDRPDPCAGLRGG